MKKVTQKWDGQILDKLDDSLDKLLLRAETGALVNRIEAAKNRLEDDTVNIKDILSKMKI